MQTTEDNKRESILKAAGELFATRAYHKVLLSDVAHAAGVGKGTIYLYFKDKDDLFLSTIQNAFIRLVDRLREGLKVCQAGPERRMEVIIRHLSDHLASNVHFMRLLRSGSPEAVNPKRWAQKREELAAVVETVLRQGRDEGVFQVEDPNTTAWMILGCARTLFLFASDGEDRDSLTERLLHFVFRSLGLPRWTPQPKGVCPKACEKSSDAETS